MSTRARATATSVTSLPPSRRPSTPRLLRWAIPALLSVVAACSGPSVAADAAVDATPYELAVRPHDGSDAGIELRLGFQGFRYTRVVFEASGPVPPVTAGRVRFEIDGFDAAEQRLRDVTFREVAAGRFETEPVMVYANDVTPARAVGRPARLTVELDDGRRRGRAVLAGAIRWDPNCVEDMEFRCQLPTDAGGP